MIRNNRWKKLIILRLQKKADAPGAAADPLKGGVRPEKEIGARREKMKGGRPEHRGKVEGRVLVRPWGADPRDFQILRREKKR